MSTTRTRPRPRAAGRPKPRKRTGPSPLVIGGVVVVALLIVAMVFTAGDTGTVEGQTAPVEVTGQALPAFADAQADPAVGLPAPALRGVGFDGEQVTVEPGDGPMVVLFGAHWCPHCQREVTELSPWLAEGAAAELGVDVVMVSTGVDPKAPNYPPSAWFEREGWSDPVLLDSENGEAAEAYGLSGYPFFAFVDADGRVAGRASGGMGVEAFEAVLDRLAR